MKKGLLFTLAVLCVSAAQAVTTNWYSNSSSTNNYTATCSGVQLNLGEAGVEYAAQVSRVNFMINSSSNFIANNTMTTLYASLIVAADSSVLKSGIVAQMYTNANITSPEGAKVGGNQAYAGGSSFGFLSFNLDGIQLDADTNYKLCFYTDESCTQSASISLRGYWDSSRDPENVYLDANGDEVVHQNVAVSAHTWYAGTAVVPEPTVLALLALGAAGLALKRKVA